MLVHICCSVDSHYFLEQIKKEYPYEKIIGFFYDPNIHPYSEYILRLEDVKYSCNILGIELIEGDYDLESWLKSVKGYENEPEKGDRCTICFDKRLSITAQKAVELDHDKFTTTLLISPKKSQDKLKIIGNTLAQKYNLTFIFKDYRSGNGMELQAKEVKKYNIYRQDYCGCMFALNAQREYQDRLADELISPINKQVLPESIEERLQLYRKRDQNSTLIKQRFLNYRLLNAKVMVKKQIISSYFLCYSTIKNKKSTGKIEKLINNIGYFARDEIKLLSLDTFNTIANTNYKTTMELSYSPPKFKDELKIRDKILNNSFYNLSAIIVLDKLEDIKYNIFCNAKIYEDTQYNTLIC